MAVPSTWMASAMLSAEASSSWSKARSAARAA
jgi:hypothetical protein